MHKTKNSLSEAVRTKSIALLGRNLALSIDLSLQTKQAHWNVKGPNFIALHELFDSVAEEAEEFADSVAERVAALGGQVEGTINVVGRHTSLPAYPVEITSGRDHVDALSTSMAVVGKSIRGSIERAVELGDADTADLFTEVSRGLDMKLWFVESHLHGNA